MKKEQVLELMSTIGPDLIGEADIQAPAKRRLPKAVRAGLIAACLCLALLGTAFAAANPEAVAGFLRQFTVQVEPATRENGMEGYHVSAEIVRYPVSSFSPALLAAGEGRERPSEPGVPDMVTLRFDTREEALAFVGEAIPCVLLERGEDWGGQYKVELTYSKDQLIYVEVYTAGWASPQECVHIYTEYYKLDARNTATMGMFTDTGRAELLGSFPMANGCEAQVTLFTHDDPETGRTYATYTGTFVREGVLYQILGGGLRYPEDELLARIQAALDSFP